MNHGKGICMMSSARSLFVFVLIGAVLLIGFGLASAHEPIGTERSDPYFRELNALKQQLGNVERRVGRVESGLKATNEAVTSLAGKIANPRQTTVDKLVFGQTSDVVYVTFESPRSSQISLAVRAAVKNYMIAKYTIREVVLLSSGLSDNTERDILDADREASMKKEFGKVHMPANWSEQDGLRKDGVVGGLVIVDPPKPKPAAASAPTP